MHELKITITGRPFSKKNSRTHVPMYNWKTGKHYASSHPGKNYKDFEADAIDQLRYIPDRQKFGTMPVFIDYQFYKKGMGLQDVDNAIASINDILQHEQLKIIDDDKQILSGKFDVVPGNEEWRTDIHIRQLYCNPEEHRIDPETMLCSTCGMSEKFLLLMRRGGVYA